ncbi:high-potential iron-sulfur protein [Congregibacter variabilis]|uniref:High-potential iron-sulfur protein n=1 Tax=Congregibacter variabilis TaxID=3081200 RepID=A0ABZ0I7E0_9GAMM|nr:high-potential iron-sulfur protein [Congregibacter sp. IMCC43200]
MDKNLSRRTVLLRGLQIPMVTGIVAALAACESDGDDALVCADPGSMSSAQESVRRTLKYTEISSDSAKTCAACEFFHGAKDGGGGCGSCEIFAGELVNPGGYCDSWSVDS